MKIIKYKVAGKLYQLETGPEAQVGDQVKLFLDTEANPELPEFIFGIIQAGIQTTGCCDEFTVYPIEYDETDLGSGFLRQDDILNVEVVAAVDVVAKDLQDEIERAIAAEELLQENIEDEEAARIAADSALDARTDILEADSVRYTSQTNSAARQEQARSNVGIGGRILRDSSGNASVDWQNRTLVSSAGANIFSWETGILNDPGGNQRINLNNPSLNDDSGVVLNWDSGFGLYLSDGKGIETGIFDGSSFATAADQKISFHGALPTVQRAGATQIAIPTTVLTVSNPPTQAEVQAVIDRLALVTTLVNEQRLTLVEKGIMKGSA